MRKKRVGVIVAIGVGALVLAAVLARCGDERLNGGTVVAPPAKKVDFPRDRAMRALRERAKTKQATTTTPTKETAGRDRLTRAMSSPGKNGAVMIEVNALRHSPLVDAILECRKQQNTDDANGLALLKSEFGIDLTEDVDRVAMDAEVLAVSGFFSKLQLPADVGVGTAYGDGGRIFSMTTDDNKPAFMAKVGDDLMLTSTDEGQLKAAIDRAEGRAEAPPSFPEGIVGGEIYGLIGPELLKGLVGLAGDSPLAPFSDMLTTSALRVAVDEDAALSLDLGARSPEDADQLSRAIGGALAVARADAKNNGHDELAALLEQARVEPRGDGSIALDVAVPGKDLLRILGCPAATTTAPTP